MRTGLNFLQLSGLTALGLFIVACGDSSAGSGAGGGGGSDPTTSNSVTNTGPGPVTGTGTGSTMAGPGPTPASNSSGGNCTAEVFADPEVNTCGQDNCCDEMTACEADFTLCFDQKTGAIDPTLPDGEALNTCMTDAGCFGANICDSGIGFTDPDAETIEYAACLTENCCDEFTDCTAGGTDAQACIDCLNGDLENYDLCAAANDCSLEFCDQALFSYPICDSGLAYSSQSVAECLSDACCDEVKDCTGPDPEDADAVQACIDCYNSEDGGPLCDAAIACEEANCSTAICESGLVIDDVELAACLTANCCVEHTSCAGDGSEEDVQACIDCFNSEEGGPLCDEAIACQDEFCGGGEGGGGQGGSGPGVGGGGGAGGAGGN